LNPRVEAIDWPRRASVHANAAEVIYATRSRGTGTRSPRRRSEPSSRRGRTATRIAITRRGLSSHLR
jgi:hypothetical protein